MRVAVHTTRMANTTFVHKPGKHSRYGSPIFIGLRIALAFLFLAATVLMWRQGASRSNWTTLAIYLFVFVATDRIAFAIRLRILSRESQDTETSSIDPD